MPIGSAPTASPGPAAHQAPGSADAIEPLPRAIIAGDSDAFARFYEVWFDRALFAALAFTRRDEAFCLDVAQEAMLRAARAMPLLNTEDDAQRWLHSLVRSAAIDTLRAESRRLSRELHHASAAPAATDTDSRQHERIAWLREQIAALSQDEQRLLARRFGAGDPLERAGRLAGISGDAAHGRVRRLLARLRKLGEGIFP